MINFGDIEALARSAIQYSDVTTLPPGIEDWQISEFQIRTGIAIPSKLRTWLQFTNGPGIGIQGIYGIRTADKFYDIEVYLDLYPGWCQSRWIPIGGDGCGNYYVIAPEVSKSVDTPVFFVDCIRDPYSLRYIVASELFYFIESYIKTELGEHGWPCNKSKVTAEDPDIMKLNGFNKCWDL